MVTCRNILVESLLNYALILATVFVLSYLRFPSSSQFFQHPLKNYLPIIMIIVLMFLIFVYLIACLTIKRQTVLYIVVVFTLLFIHGFICLHVITSSQRQLYDDFSVGDNNWIGNNFYRKQNYKLNALGLTENQETSQLIHELDNGVKALNSWLANHVLVYGLLDLAWRSFGLVAFVLILLILMLAYCSGKHRNKFIFLFGICMFILFIVLLVVSDVLKVIISLNHHPICLDKSFSSGPQIIINLINAQRMKQLSDDAVYTNICTLLDPYFHKSVHLDSWLCYNTLDLCCIGSCWILVYLIAMTMKQNEDWGWRSFRQWRTRENYVQIEQEY